MTITDITSDAATIPGVTHHTFQSGDAVLHYVTAGAEGSPILLVHGWPETWWAFRSVIPLLAASHRVVAVDLRGFGEATASEGDYTVEASAEDLHRLIEHVGHGAVHLATQDLSGHGRRRRIRHCQRLRRVRAHLRSPSRRTRPGGPLPLAIHGQRRSP